ncbi:MAG: gamma-glutamylcyclotransferase family protein [Rhodospirillaceae bacterium]
MSLLFAYASNLNRERMSERCPAAEPVGTASLANHRLVFRVSADIEPYPGATALGAVWRLSPADMIALDHYEGFPTLYRKDFRHVLLAGGEAVEVMLYRMNREGYAPPPDDYLEIIRDGYRDFGLPENYLDSAVELSTKLRPAVSNRPSTH